MAVSSRVHPTAHFRRFELRCHQNAYVRDIAELRPNIPVSSNFSNRRPGGSASRSQSDISTIRKTHIVSPTICNSRSFFSQAVFRLQQSFATANSHTGSTAIAAVVGHGRTGSRPLPAFRTVAGLIPVAPRGSNDSVSDLSVSSENHCYRFATLLEEIAGTVLGRRGHIRICAITHEIAAHQR